jgi:hypothetical protein
MALTANAEIIKQGKTYIQTSNVGTETPYEFKDSKENVYKIFITKNGRCYVNKTSQKTGKSYKYYLPEEVSREIADKCNIPYTYKKK